MMEIYFHDVYRSIRRLNCVVIFYNVYETAWKCSAQTYSDHLIHIEIFDGLLVTVLVPVIKVAYLV